MLFTDIRHWLFIYCIVSCSITFIVSLFGIVDCCDIVVHWCCWRVTVLLLLLSIPLCCVDVMMLLLLLLMLKFIVICCWCWLYCYCYEGGIYCRIDYCCWNPFVVSIYLVFSLHLLMLHCICPILMFTCYFVIVTLLFDVDVVVVVLLLLLFIVDILLLSGIVDDIYWCSHYWLLLLLHYDVIAMMMLFCDIIYWCDIDVVICYIWCLVPFTFVICLLHCDVDIYIVTIYIGTYSDDILHLKCCRLLLLLMTDICHYLCYIVIWCCPLIPHCWYIDIVMLHCWCYLTSCCWYNGICHWCCDIVI